METDSANNLVKIMAIELGTQTVEVKKKRVTWRFQSDACKSNGEIISDPQIEVFRALQETIGGEVSSFTPELKPLTIQASKLSELIPYLEPSAQLQALFTQEQLAKIVPALPLLLMASFDAMERKAIDEASAAV